MRSPRALLLLLPAALFLALHLPALDHELVWMDETEITGGEILVAPDALATAFLRPLHASAAPGLGELRNPYYRPLHIVLASVLHARFGDAPRAWRGVSLALGALALGLFALLGARLFGRVGPACVAACLVAAHPVGIEPWSWLSAVSEALAAPFVLAALLAGFGAACQSRPVARAGLAALSIAAFALALLSKEKGLIAPALLAALVASAALSVVPDARSGAPRVRPRLRAAALLLAAQAAIALVYLGVLRPLALGSAIGAAPSIGGSRLVHVASALAAWPAELAWLWLPLHSTTSDAVAIVTSPFDARIGLALLLAVGSALAWAVLLRRGYGVAAFGLAWLWIAFLPTANLIPQIHARADRYLFLSAFGAALLTVACADRLLSRIGGRTRSVLAILLAVLAVGGLAQRTAARLPDWRSTEALFARDVAGDPGFREGRFHLARRHLAAGRPADAWAQLEVLLGQRPADTGRASFVNRVGLQQLACETRLALDRPREVLAEYRTLEAAQPQLARLPALRLCVAEAAQALGEHREAVALLRGIASELPGLPPARLSLALARSYIALHEPAEARTWLARAEAAAAGDPASRREIVNLRAALGRP